MNSTCPLYTFLFEFNAADFTTPGSVHLANQLFACKSIDKLISESEEPEHRLKKTLGPWSLTALGIGAVIGSGIFTVVGTAIAGQKFDTSSILNAPLADYIVHHPPRWAAREPVRHWRFR